MKHYKMAVIGATVMSAGIASVLGKDAIIIEKSESVATDYVSCVNVKLAFINECDTLQGEEFKNELSKRNIISEDGKCHIFPVSGICAKYLQKSNTLLSTDVISIESEQDGYVLTLFNIDGFTKIKVDYIIDTTSMGIEDKDYDLPRYKKYLNAVIIGKNPPESDFVIRGRFEDEYIFSMPVESSVSYSDAINMLCTIWEQNAQKDFCGFRLASIAPAFAYLFEEKMCRNIDNKYIHMPSASCDNLGKAFEEGVYAAQLYI